MEQVKQVTKLEAGDSCPFVGESLRILREEVGNQSTVLGFVGAPFTLATYIVEGGSSKSFAHTKKMAFANPEVRARRRRPGGWRWARRALGDAAVAELPCAEWRLCVGGNPRPPHRQHLPLHTPRPQPPGQPPNPRDPKPTPTPPATPQILHALLDKLADNIADYVRYQADAGAQAVQIFDSWASHLSPQDFDVFAGPYIRKVIEDVRKTHPSLPIILYISGSGGLLERMAAANPDIISIDQSVDIVDGIKRVGSGFAIQVRGGGWGVGAWGLGVGYLVC